MSQIIATHFKCRMQATNANPTSVEFDQWNVATTTGVVACKTFDEVVKIADDFNGKRTRIVVKLSQRDYNASLHELMGELGDDRNTWDAKLIGVPTLPNGKHAVLALPGGLAYGSKGVEELLERVVAHLAAFGFDERELVVEVRRVTPTPIKGRPIKTARRRR